MKLKKKLFLGQLLHDHSPGSNFSKHTWYGFRTAPELFTNNWQFYRIILKLFTNHMYLRSERHHKHGKYQVMNRRKRTYFSTFLHF